MGAVRSRPRLSSFFPSLGGNRTVNGLKTYASALANILMVWDSLGNLYQEATPNNLTLVKGGGVPGLFYNSTTLFGREYMAFFDGKSGQDIPRQFDGTNYDRVSQTGPGAAPAAVDSGTAGNITAGLRQVTVSFITRQGFITCPAPPVSWTAGGGKKVALTNIPTGPPNVVARLLLFTQAIVAPATTGPFYSLPTGSSTPTSTMLIADNTTVSLTVDFLDSILASGFNAQYLFAQVELGECASVNSYNSRTVWLGERNKIKADGGGGGFNNLTFDGGFGTGPPTLANAGPNFPSVASLGWANPNNIFATDGIVASALMLPSGVSPNIIAAGFAFAIPGNATILGIQVVVLAKGDVANKISDNQIYLYNLSSGPLSPNHSNGNLLTAGLAAQSYGGPNDTWGAALTPAIINNSGQFGVLYSAKNNDAANNRTVSTDSITIKVFYSTPSAMGLPPLGWTQGGTFAGGDSALNKALTAYWGDAFSITGDGATAVRGLITQPAAVDYLGNKLINIGIAYSVRARVAISGAPVQGTLHINLQSTTGAFTTPGLSLQAGQLTAAYQEFTGVLLTSPLSVVPADLLLQVYADGTLSNNGVFLIDCIEIFPTNSPVNSTIARISHANNPESFDGLLDVVQIAAPGASASVQSLRASWQLRTNLYLAKDHYLCYVTDDGVNEPASWTITEVSNTIGCCGPNAWDGVEEWVVFADRSGLYLTSGSDPVKIMQEIQEDVSGNNKPNWNQTNWLAGYTVWVRIAREAKRLILGLPVNSALTPNQVFHMDYKFSPTGEAITTAMAPTYSAFTGRILVHGSARKWSPWTMTANCCALIERPDGTLQTFLGNGVGNGKIYELVDAAVQGSDDGVAVNNFFQTYGSPSKSQEDELQLRAHRKICEYVTGLVTGSGILTLQATSPYRTTNIRSIILSLNPAGDFERKVSIHGERIFWTVGTNAINNWFQLERLIPSLKADPTIPIRGLSA